jgi:hypothetical protein
VRLDALERSLILLSQLGFSQFPPIFLPLQACVERSERRTPVRKSSDQSRFREQDGRRLVLGDRAQRPGPASRSIPCDVSAVTARHRAHCGELASSRTAASRAPVDRDQQFEDLHALEERRLGGAGGGTQVSSWAVVNRDAATTSTSAALIRSHRSSPWSSRRLRTDVIASSRAAPPIEANLLAARAQLLSGGEHVVQRLAQVQQSDADTLDVVVIDGTRRRPCDGSPLSRDDEPTRIRQLASPVIGDVRARTLLDGPSPSPWRGRAKPSPLCSTWAAWTAFLRV